jgi:hypothetical protein
MTISQMATLLRVVGAPNRATKRASCQAFSHPGGVAVVRFCPAQTVQAFTLPRDNGACSDS